VVTVYQTDGKVVTHLTFDAPHHSPLLGFSQDDKILIVGNASGLVGKHRWGLVKAELFEVATNRHLRSIEMRAGAGAYGCLSPDGKTLIVSGIDVHAALYDLDTGKEVGALTSPDHLPDGPVPRGGNSQDPEWLKWRKNVTNCLAISPDGKFLALGTQGGVVSVWDLGRKKRLWRDEGHDTTVRAVAFAPDGKTVASLGTDRRVVLWSRDRGVQEAQRYTKRGVFECLAYSKVGPSLLVGGQCAGKTGFRAWTPTDGGWWVGEVSRTEKENAHARVLAVSPDGNTVAAGYREIKLWDVKKMLTDPPAKP
jgi:WD40 repeat protein